jgi:hypothetical protein
MVRLRNGVGGLEGWRVANDSSVYELHVRHATPRVGGRCHGDVAEEY